MLGGLNYNRGEVPKSGWHVVGLQKSLPTFNLHCLLDWTQNHHQNTLCIYEGISRKVELRKESLSRIWGALSHGLGSESEYQGESERSISIHLSLTPDCWSVWPATLHSCHLGLTTGMNCTLKSRDKINPSCFRQKLCHNNKKRKSFPAPRGI